MLTIYSLIPFFVPVLVAYIVMLSIQDRPLNEDKDFDSWDNDLTW